MNTKFTIFTFVVFACFAFVGHANMYNEWAQQSAINLQPEAISYAAANLIADSIHRKRNIETALNNNAAALPRPSVGLISSAEVSGYPYVDRYLTELDDKDISHYYILREDYKFQDLSGGSITIPAGFIWDGASIPTSLLELALEVGNTRYNSALSEGLIHDFMYRDPRRFSQEDADDLLYVNLVRCANADPMKIYTGVRARGGEAYQGHKRRQDQGLYDVFTPEFYAGNLKTFQGGKDSSDTTKPEKCSISVKPEEGKLDFYCLVPDKIWTEPIIGALVACEGCGNRKVDWWGAKWMGGCFDPTPAHDDLTFEHHSMYGSYKHLVGFTLNTCMMPKVYVAPLSEFSLSDAQSIEEKVRLWIEENIGVKLSKTTQTEDVKHESYTREYSCVSEYCRVYFKSSIEAGGHRWVQKHGEKGLYEKVIRLKMNICVYCDDWYKERLNFDNSRYSVRDLLQGKVKRK